MPEGGPPVETISSDGVSQLQTRRAMWNFVRTAMERTSPIGGAIYRFADEIHVHMTANQSNLGTTGTHLDGSREGAQGTLDARMGIVEDLFSVWSVGVGPALGAETSAALRARSTANNAAEGLRLNKSLASQSQMSEAGIPLAGPGAPIRFRDAERVAEQYGGNASLGSGIYCNISETV